MIHEVTQAANRAAAIVKWLEASPAAVIHTIMQQTSIMVLLHHSPNLVVYYSSTKD